MTMFSLNLATIITVFFFQEYMKFLSKELNITSPSVSQIFDHNTLLSEHRDKIISE